MGRRVWAHDDADAANGSESALQVSTRNGTLTSASTNRCMYFGLRFGLRVYQVRETASMGLGPPGGTGKPCSGVRAARPDRGTGSVGLGRLGGAGGSGPWGSGLRRGGLHGTACTAFRLFWSIDGLVCTHKSPFCPFGQAPGEEMMRFPRSRVGMPEVSLGKPTHKRGGLTINGKTLYTRRLPCVCLP